MNKEGGISMNGNTSGSDCKEPTQSCSYLVRMKTVDYSEWKVNKLLYFDENQLDVYDYLLQMKNLMKPKVIYAIFDIIEGKIVDYRCYIPTGEPSDTWKDGRKRYGYQQSFISETKFNLAAIYESIKSKIPSIPVKIEIWISGASHYPDEERENGYFYFELRDPDEGLDTIIEDWAVCNNIGSIKATSDILADAITAGVCRKMEDGKKREPVLESELKKIYKKVVWH